MTDVNQKYTGLAKQVRSNERFMKVMLLLSLTIGWSALVVFAAIQSSIIPQFLMSGGIIIPLIMFAFLMLIVFGMSHFKDGPIGLLLLFLLSTMISLLMSVSVSLALKSPSGMLIVLGSLAGTFIILASITILNYLLKRDLGFMGNTLFAISIILFIALLVSMFVQIPIVNLVLSVLIVCLFTVYLLYDINQALLSEDDRSIIFYTATIYLDLVNIFINLLRIFSSR